MGMGQEFNLNTSILIFIFNRDETGRTQNWLKCAETSCNSSICEAVPELQRLTRPSRETFSYLIYSHLRGDKFDQNLQKLANWLHSHIPV